MKKKFKVGDLVHLNPKSIWNNGNIFNPLRTLGIVVDTDDFGWNALPIEVRWGQECLNSILYNEEDLLLAPESIILKYLDESLEEELKKLGIKS